MQASQTLNEAGVRRALAILEREQRELLPTRWQQRWYWLLNLVLGMFFPLLVTFVVIAMVEEDQDVTPQFAGALLVTTVLFASVLPLFLLNIPLMRRLKRHADLRKRIGLGKSFRQEFAAAREEGRIRNLFTALMVPLGALVTVASLIGIGYGAWAVAEDATLAFFYLTPSFFSLFFGLGLVSLHFFRRAKERLEIVVRLQESLTSRRAALSEDQTGVEIDPASYRHIAGIERAHIVRDRRTNIRQARREKQEPYVVQTSRAAQAARGALEMRSQLRVQDQVVALTRDPRPAEASVDEESGLLVLAIPETTVRIEYRVDDAARRIQVYSLESVAEGGAT